MTFGIEFSWTPYNLTREEMQTELLEWYYAYRHYMWLACPFLPIVTLFILPVVLLIMIYVSALFVHAYKWYYCKVCQTNYVSWDKPLYLLSLFWEFYGWIYYGYEIEGLENIPDKGPAVVIFYHGALPMDWYYLVAKCYLTKKRLMVSVADRLLFKIPGWGLLMKISRVIPGSSEDCIRELKSGNIICLSPGGLREAQFGDENYKLMWGKRCGFARVAMDAKVPIIPVFTKNVRESFSTLLIFRKWQKNVYEKKRYPTAPLYGGFPVKLKTFVGPPIPYDATATPEELRNKAKESMEWLILQHQRVPGSVVHALLERFIDFTKQKVI